MKYGMIILKEEFSHLVDISRGLAVCDNTKQGMLTRSTVYINISVCASMHRIAQKL